MKKRVWERDKGCCVICGSGQSVMPNAHYISRSKGGLGIEENIVTLCTPLSINKCHERYDNGDAFERQWMGKMIADYLRACYPGWDEAKLIYKK
ncbi:hypothetical protein LJC20_00380 [Eubacteriales bacterium OttesenSCG-928-M02]|nr:hypothetical protein [Eubacteriales bacterium OttesenSCG-928-M02]